MGKYKNGKYVPSKGRLLGEIIGFVFYMAFIGAFLALLVWLVSHILPIYIPLVIAVVLWIVGVKNEYQVRKIRYNTEKHGTWGSGNPYPLGTIEHDLYETKRNLEEINKKL